jgi:hypothetical protein
LRRAAYSPACSKAVILGILAYTDRCRFRPAQVTDNISFQKSQFGCYVKCPLLGSALPTTICRKARSRPDDHVVDHVGQRIKQAIIRRLLQVVRGSRPPGVVRTPALPSAASTCPRPWRAGPSVARLGRAGYDMEKPHGDGFGLLLGCEARPRRAFGWIAPSRRTSHSASSRL